MFEGPFLPGTACCRGTAVRGREGDSWQMVFRDAGLVGCLRGAAPGCLNVQKFPWA